MSRQPPQPQPAKGLLASRRITNRRIARSFQLSEHYVGRVLNGWDPPSARFRQQLAAFVDLPEEALFHPADIRSTERSGAA